MNSETGELPPSLYDLIATVGYFQAAYDRAEEHVKALEAEHAALYEARAAAKAELATYQAQLRTATINAHLAGEELPAPLSVRWDERLDYKLEEAVPWAQVHAPECFKFDEPAFKRAVKKLRNSPFKTMRVPVAVIGNLSRVTAGVREIEGVVAA
jgi:hypothetical protein